MKSSYITILACAAIMTGCTNTGDIRIPKVNLPTNSTASTQAAPVSSTHQAFDLPTAISIAEAKTGGVAVNLEVYHGHGGGAYEIETITATHEYTVLIDARSGDVLSIDQEYDVNVLPNVNLRLKDALIIAQNAQAGVVREVDLERKVTGSYYEVKIDGVHPYELHIDAANGQILSSRVDYDD